MPNLVPNSIRGKLIIGLLPGFLVLVSLAAVSLYAINLLADANIWIADASREMEFTQSLQLTLQRALIPFDDYMRHGQHDDNRRQFSILANSLDRQFGESRSAYGEESEIALHRLAESNWKRVHDLAEKLFADSLAGDAPDSRNAIMADIQSAAQAAWNNLDDLRNHVEEEVAETLFAAEVNRRLATQLLILTTIVLLLAGTLFVIYFSRYLTKPIEALQVGATRIGGGDLSFRLAVERSDELGELAAEFNRMADGLQDSHEHLEQRVAERTAQLETVAEASRIIASELDLNRVLQTLADLARDLGQARYVAVMVPRQQPGAAPRFIHSYELDSDVGFPAQPPQGCGLLGELLTASGPIRVDDVGSHPSAAGFPDDHPIMHCFLGIPIRIFGRTIGGLYIAERIDRRPFDVEDEQILMMLADHAAVAIENARLYSQVIDSNQELESRVRQRTGELQAVNTERTLYAEKLRQALHHTVRVQEAERRRIAKDIHDGISQWLMGALFETQAARVRLSDQEEEAGRHLREAQRLLKTVKDEMHRVVHALHPAILEGRGLAAAIGAYVDEIKPHVGIELDFVLRGEARRLDPIQELTLFRIVQEAINNVTRHANTDRAEIRLTFSEECARLTVVDQGSGFDLKGLSRHGHSQLGLLSMEERAAAAGAILDIQSSQGSGTRIEVSAPYANDMATNSLPRA